MIIVFMSYDPISSCYTVGYVFSLLGSPLMHHLPTVNGASCMLLGQSGFNWCFSFAPELVSYLAPRVLHRRAAYSICESSFLIHHGGYHDLFICS